MSNDFLSNYNAPSERIDKSSLDSSEPNPSMKKRIVENFETDLSSAKNNSKKESKKSKKDCSIF